MPSIEIDEIMQFLPHRYPFLLVDRVLDYELGKSIVGIKNVTFNEPHFTGHFPQKPIMPGVLMTEALAQISGMLTLLTTNTKPAPDNWLYFAGIDQARFKRIVSPGDQLLLKATIIKQRRDIWVFESEASVAGELACSAEIMLIKRGL